MVNLKVPDAKLFNLWLWKSREFKFFDCNITTQMAYLATRIEMRDDNNKMRREMAKQDKTGEETRDVTGDAICERETC